MRINKPNFLHSSKDCFLKLWQPFSTNMAKDFNRIFPKRKRDTVENGLKIFLLIVNGYIRETQTGEYKEQKEVKLLINDEFFVFVIPCIKTFFMK